MLVVSLILNQSHRRTVENGGQFHHAAQQRFECCHMLHPAWYLYVCGYQHCRSTSGNSISKVSSSKKIIFKKSYTDINNNKPIIYIIPGIVLVPGVAPATIIL